MNPPEPERDDDDDVEAVLRQTRADFVGGFQAACAAMAQLIDDLHHNADAAARGELERVLHRMGGLAGTIGLPTVSLRARELEDVVRDTTSERLDSSYAGRLLDAIRLGFEQDTAT
jgi:HPt (histidine-containing phosphotransfer) domain-containing protein